MKNVLEASALLQKMDLNENYNMVAKTNHRSLNKMLKSSHTVDSNVIK